MFLPVCLCRVCVFERTPQDLVVSVKSIDDFAADACDILLRPAVEVFTLVPRLFLSFG